jgi:hypothetical protein
MAHNIRLDDATYDAYQHLANVVGLPSVQSAIVFTAKQAIPGLIAKFTPDSNPTQSVAQIPQIAAAIQQLPQLAEPSGPSTPTAAPMPLEAAPKSAGAKMADWMNS